MFKNYFKIAFQKSFQRKGYTLLNIFGLAIGIGCCLLIFQYVSYEKSYDNFQTNGNQIVRLRLDQYKQGKLAMAICNILSRHCTHFEKRFS